MPTVRLIRNKLLAAFAWCRPSQHTHTSHCRPFLGNSVVVRFPLALRWPLSSRPLVLCAEQHVFRASPSIPSRAALRPADVTTWFAPCTPPGGPVPTAAGVSGAPGCAVPASAGLPLLKSSGTPSPTLECQSGRCLGDISSFPSRRTLLKVPGLGSPALGFFETSPSRANLNVTAPGHCPR